MGLGGISVWQLVIILVIVLLIFGTKKLRGIGSDLGGAVKGFKDSMSDEEKQAQAVAQEQAASTDEPTQETKKDETTTS